MDVLVSRLLASCLVSSRAGTSRAYRSSSKRAQRGTREEAEKKGVEEGVECRGCLIKQFRYGGRRNMRSYPPSLNAPEIFMQLPVRRPKKGRRCSARRESGTAGWKVYRRVF